MWHENRIIIVRKKKNIQWLLLTDFYFNSWETWICPYLENNVTYVMTKISKNIVKRYD